MKVLFDDVVPGFPLGGPDVDRLKQEILAMVEGMGFKKMTYNIPNFKDSQNKKIAIAFTVSSVDRNAVHLVKVSGQRTG